MTVRSTKRTFNKIIRLADNAGCSVDFNDENGNKIACNYFSVDCQVSGTNVALGWFAVQPSGGDGQGGWGGGFASTASGAGGWSQTVSATAGNNHTTSGFGGVVGATNSKIEMSLRTQDKTQGIRLYSFILGGTAANTIFLVTYGNTKQANPARDQDDNFYPPGD